MKLIFLRSKLRVLSKLSLIRTPSAATRKIMAAIFVLTIVVIVSWAAFKSYRDQSGGTYISGASEPFPQAVVFRVTILSVDEVTGTVQVKPQVIDETDKGDSVGYMSVIHFRGFPPKLIMVLPLSNSELSGYLAHISDIPPQMLGKPPRGSPAAVLTGPAPSALPNFKLIGGSIPLHFGPLALHDLGQQFELHGVAAFAFLNPEKEDFPKLPEDSKPTPTNTSIEYANEAPSAPPSELEVSGNSELYPFDSYLLIGKVSCSIHALGDKNEFIGVDVTKTDVDLRSTGFVLKNMSFAELSKLHPDVPEHFGVHVITKDKSGKVVFNNDADLVHWRDIASENRTKIFAVELRRPFFLRFFSVFLLVIAISSMVYYSVVSNVKEFGVQALGYFFGLWAARQVLMSNGPKAFTAVDYVVFFLYSMLVAVLVAKAIWPEKGSQPSA